MKLRIGTVLYYDSEVDIDMAREYIAHYALSSDDVKMVRLDAGGLIIKTKREIALGAEGNQHMEESATSRLEAGTPAAKKPAL